MKSIYSFLFILIFTMSLNAQNKQLGNQRIADNGLNFVPPPRNCGTMLMDSIRRAENPSLGTLEDFEKWLAPQVEAYERMLENGSLRGRAVYKIPVIMHVINNGEAKGTGSNISQAQLNSQIDVLNADFRKLNADRSLIPTAFQAAHADIEINFCLALRDPSGNTLTEPGIERINRSTKGWSAPPYSNMNYINTTIKPNSSWDPTKYLNVWVLDHGTSLLGFAQFPDNTPSLGGLGATGGNANTDGVVCHYKYFGTIGSVAPYNKGRTATHEIGHWLGLRHISGDASCDANNDYCADTPRQKGGFSGGTGGLNYGCPTYPFQVNGCGVGTSPNGEMFMNYMDYVNDACMQMFTNNQKSRMQAIMGATGQGAPRRASLNSSTVCDPLTQRDVGISAILSPTGSSCRTTFSPTVTLSNFGSSTLTSVTINYRIDANPNSTYAWSGSLAMGATVNVTLPSMTTSLGAHTFTAFTSNMVPSADQNSANDQSSGPFTIIAQPSTVALPFAEGFEGATFVPNGWTIENPDASAVNKWSQFVKATVFRGGGFGNSNSSAKMDFFSGTSATIGELDNLITPNFSFVGASAPLKMDFNVAYARYSAANHDSLIIYITSNCGGTWQRVWAKGNSGGANGLATAPDLTTSFTPSSAAQWRAESINLDAYIGIDNVQFMFQGKSGWGNNLYLDDINLYYTAATPIANFTGTPTTICAGQTVTYTDQSTNTPTSWNWSFPGGTPSTSTAQNPTVTYNTAGIYNATLTAINSGGSNSITKTNYITVNPNPTVSVNPAAPSICAGASVSLTASGATTYSWSPAAGLSATTGSTVTASPTNTSTYTVTGTSLGCSGSSNVTVTVVPLPNVSVSPTAITICSGSQTTLTASGATTYSWSPAAGLSSTSGASVTASPASTTTYTVQGTTSGCSNSANTAITVTPTPTVSISPAAATICSGSSTVLTASGATSYTWSPSTGLSSTSGATVTASPTADITYTVTGVSSGCSNTANSIITVIALPSVSVSPANPTICSGGSVALTASGASTYSWGPASGLSATTGANVNASPGTSTTYTVTGTQSGCSNTANVLVNVQATPVIVITPASATICSGNSVALAASGANTYSWSPASGLSATTGSNVIANPSSTQTYNVTGTSNGCSGNGSVTLTVTPKFTLSMSSTLASCSVNDGSASVLVTGGSNPSYLWNDISAQSTATANSLGAGMYQVVVNDDNGCKDSASIAVNNPTPIVDISPASATLCVGDSVSLTASGATTYSWSPTTGLSSGTGATVMAKPTSTTTYTALGSTAGCTNSKSVTITVNPKPVMSVSPSVATVCPSESVVLSAGGASSYNWSPSATLSSSTGSSVTATPASNTIYTVVGTTGFGCKDSATASVNVNSALAISVTPASPTICSGQSVSLTASGATNYTWSPSIGLSSTTGTTVTASPSVTTTYTVVGASGSCSSSTTVTVTVDATPVVSVSPASPTICAGSSTMLTASGATSYSWSPVTGLDATSGATVTASPSSSTTYIVTGTTAGCSSTTSVLVAVDALPLVSVNPASPSICAGQSISLTASGATTYSWSPSAGLNTTNGPTVLASPSLTTTYTVTGVQGGCSNTMDVTVTVNTVPVVTVTPSSATICEGSSVALSAEGATSYSWTPTAGLDIATGSNVQASPTTTTTYTVVGTSNGCSSSTNTAITVKPKFTFTTSSTLASCSTNDGSATASVTGGTGPINYLWDDALFQTASTAINLGAGIYKVIISDASGCMDSANVTVNNPTPIVSITPSSSTICAGDSVELTASGAVTYSWNPSVGLNTTTGAVVMAKPITTTTYTALGSNSGCTNSKTVTITVIPLPNVVVNPSVANICDGGSISLTASNATTYTWSPSTGINTTSGATVIASPSTSITYTVTGTSGACSKSVNVPVNVTVSPVLAISASPDSICAGGSTTITVSGSGSYTWTPSSGLSATTGSTVTANPSATTTYQVTEGASGCNITKSITIKVNALPIVTLNPSNQTICAGSTVTLNASGASTYTWSPSSGLSATTGSSVDATPAVNTVYTVSGTTIFGCSNTANSSITVNPLPALTLNTNLTSICNGGSVNLVAGGASTYSWTPFTGLSSANSPTVIANPNITTTYTVTGTSSGCSKSDTVRVIVNPKPTVAVSPASASICIGGSVNLTANGATTYNWSNAGSLSSSSGASVTASPVVTTTYTVTGTDLNACTNIKNVTVTVVAAPSVVVSASSSTICAGDSSTLTASGASSYNWDLDPSLSAVIGDVVSAFPSTTTTYTVTGFSSGCATTSSANVTINVTPLPNVTLNTPSPICKGTATLLTANNADSYTWSPVSGLSSSTGSLVGASPDSTTTYTVTGIKDACSNSVSVTVTVNPSPNLSVSPSSAVICSGDAQTLIASGATTYSWNPSSGLNTSSGSTVIASPSSPTTYLVTGTIGTCSANTSVFVDVNTKPTLVLSSNFASICEGETATITASGANAFSWNADPSLSATTGSTVDATPLLTTMYYVVGTSNGCTDNDSILITVNSLPKLNIVPGKVNNICEGDSVELIASGATTYTWTPSLGLNTSTGSTVIASPGMSRTYMLTGTKNGCTSTENIDVNVMPQFTLSTSSNNDNCDKGIGSATVFVSGGGPGLTYLWNDPSLQSNSTATALNVGTYWVHVTDNFNCKDSTSVFVGDINPLVINLSYAEPSCFGGSDGSVTAQVFNGAGSLTYLWNDSQFQGSSSAINLAAGNYTVLVSDANGCSKTDSLTIDEPIEISLTTDVKFTTCSAVNGEAIVFASGGTGDYTYLWNDLQGQTKDTATGLAVGNYTVLVTDINGCSRSVSVSIESISDMALSFSENSVTCFNGSDGTVKAAIQGGTRPFQYSWSDGNNQSDSAAINLMAGTYTLTVVDSNGCTKSASHLLTQASIISGEYEITHASCGFKNGMVLASALGGTQPHTIVWELSGKDSLNNVGEGSYKVKITDSKGCQISDSVLVLNELNPSCVFIPNVFSPNGDNDHDFWVFDNIQYYSNIRVVVFNRWGNKVFETEEYRNDWNGTYNGAALPGGVYFYVIDFNNGEKLINGNVTILR